MKILNATGNAISNEQAESLATNGSAPEVSDLKTVNVRLYRNIVFADSDRNSTIATAYNFIHFLLDSDYDVVVFSDGSTAFFFELGARLPVERRAELPSFHFI